MVANCKMRLFEGFSITATTVLSHLFRCHVSNLLLYIPDLGKGLPRFVLLRLPCTLLLTPLVSQSQCIGQQ